MCIYIYIYIYIYMHARWLDGGVQTTNDKHIECCVCVVLVLALWSDSDEYVVVSATGTGRCTPEFVFPHELGPPRVLGHIDGRCCKGSYNTDHIHIGTLCGVQSIKQS
jgi:hypothetical protein